MATIPVPFGKSPKGVFPSVNWGDPITKGLVVANHVDGVNGIDLVSRQTFEWLTNSVGSTPVPNNTRFGTATACLHDYGYWGGGTTFNPIAATDDVTVLMWAREDAVTNRGFFRRGKDGSGNGWSLYLKTENSACNPSFGVVWTSPSLVGRAVTNSQASINAGTGSEGMWLLGRYLQGRSLSIFCSNGTVAHDTSSVGSSMRTSTQGIALTGNTTATADNGNYVHFYGTVGNDQFIWARGLSDNECWEILSDPMRVYRRRDRVAVLVTAAGGGAFTVDAQPGSFAVTGTDATLARSRLFDAQPGTFSVNGTAATLAKGRILDAQPGTFTLSGTAATLEKTAAGAFTIDAQPGTFSISGTAATLAYGRKFDAQPGAFTLSGAAATLTKNAAQAFELNAQTGSFAIGGTAATLAYSGSSIWTDINRGSTSWTNLSPAASTWTNL